MNTPPSDSKNLKNPNRPTDLAKPVEKLTAPQTAAEHLIMLCSSDTQVLLQALAAAQKKAQTHQLKVFMYQDAALLASSAVFEASMNQVQRDWLEFAEALNLRLHVCVASALARGVTDTQNSVRHKLLDPNQTPIHTLKAGFELSGLGQLAEYITSCNSSEVF